MSSPPPSAPADHFPVTIHVKYWDAPSVTSDGSKAGSTYNSVPSQPTLLTPTTWLPSFSWETGVELLTFMDLLKSGGREGIRTPGLLVANGESLKLRRVAT